MTARRRDGFVDAELVVRATRLGFHIVQIGVDYFPRSRGESTLSSPSVIVKIIRELLRLRRDLMDVRPLSADARAADG